MFDHCFANEKTCGPKDVKKGYTYCHIGDKCPLNGLTIAKDSNKSVSLKGLDYSIDPFKDKWDGYIIYNQTNAPISNLYINIAPPCGESDVSFTPRKGPTRLYKEGECDFEMRGSPFHPHYYSTGFTVSEYNVLSENKLLNSII
eukprot:CAMPEP_0170552614 /NCGR_PEP_ID=MMETSP0211-20121228/10486_1 /TAXON_ID=311385 /ORGANISM="Pseudokeronopsis sp., Strain OXSARD2" /LENGTH=143 /DNA_ID=CAMNT_0010860439 /DNA_START=345 /DNA_END=776 /DNA_ORIENTATION=+